VWCLSEGGGDYIRFNSFTNGGRFWGDGFIPNVIYSREIMGFIRRFYIKHDINLGDSEFFTTVSFHIQFEFGHLEVFTTV
jgi:hypothetical protein